MTAHVSADAVVPCPAGTAVARLSRLAGVTSISGPGVASVRVPWRVGPRRGRALRKTVGAVVGPAAQRGRSLVSSLEWLPTGRFAGWYPALDAGLAVTAIDDTSCLLSVAGEYVPPFGRLGGLVDRAALHRVAASTVQEFTARLARAVAFDPEEGSS